MNLSNYGLAELFAMKDLLTEIYEREIDPVLAAIAREEKRMETAQKEK